MEVVQGGDGVHSRRPHCAEQAVVVAQDNAVYSLPRPSHVVEAVRVGLSSQPQP